MSAPELVEHFFRHEYGKLVATLSRRVGVHHIDAVEDAAQSALTSALESWRVGGLPNDPSAWLFRVAHNHLMGELRKGAGRRRILADRGGPADADSQAEPEAFFAAEVDDDLLRMLFVCCDEAQAPQAQLVFALKTLCGFSVREIAHRLFLTQANVYKRLTRTRTRLRDEPALMDDLGSEQLRARVPGVQRVLYLLFTEGHLSSHAELAIRTELCAEAIRLGQLLAGNPVGQTPETCALLALMYLHAARLSSRQDATGGLLLLEEQDRSAWDQEAIGAGLEWLARSAEGDAYSRYHAEAGIAAEHCRAESFEATRWDRIAQAYALLEEVAPSAVHRLNRAVAVAEWKGPGAGLAVLDGFEPPTWLAGSYQFSAVLADLHRRAGHGARARRYRDLALASAPTDAVRDLLRRRLTVS